MSGTMSGLAGNKCVYFNCGDSKRLTPGLRLFKFPSKDENLCKKWLFNSGNANTYFAKWPPELLKTKVICHKHFTDNDYRTEKRHFLKVDAVPILFKDRLKSEHDNHYNKYGYPDEYENVLIPTRTYLDKKRTFTSTRSQGDPPKKIRFQENMDGSGTFVRKQCDQPNKHKPNRKLTFPLYKFRNGAKNSLGETKNPLRKKSLYVLPILTLLSSVAKTFVMMQLKGRRRVWYRTEKDFAILLYFKSPSTYRFLRQKGLTLPSVYTIRKWISQNKFKTGDDKIMQKLFKLKCSSMTTREKKCIVAFDEISMKEYSEYNKKLDVIEGFQDLTPLGRSSQNATNALVFAIRGLYSRWKLPFAYFLSDNFTSKETLKVLILHLLKTLIDIGFTPKALICDQENNKREAVELLGASTDQPYFLYSGQKIFAIYDVPRLFNSVWNNFMSGTFQLFHKMISFSVIQEAYEIDINSKIPTTLPKITYKHINPNSVEKTSCKLAIEFFSKTVASALRTYATTGQIDKNIGHDTALFVDNMNNLFDALNSRRLFTKNPFNSGLSDRNELIFTTLKMGIRIFESLTKLTLKTSGQSKIQTLLQEQKTESYSIQESRPPCFDGIIQTINAVLELFEEEKRDKNCILLTSRLNQDFLNHYFSLIEECNGQSNQTRSFRLSFRLQTITGLFRPMRLSNFEENNCALLTSNKIKKEDEITEIFETDPYSPLTLSNSDGGIQDLAFDTVSGNKTSPVVKQGIKDGNTFKTDILVKTETTDDSFQTISLYSPSKLLNCENNDLDLGWDLSNVNTSSVLKFEDCL